MNDMSVPATYKPGEMCPQSGQYAIVDVQGTMTGIERTVVLNKPFPPTPGRDQVYLLVDATQHDAKARDLDTEGKEDMSQETERPPHGSTRHARQVYALVAYYLIVLFFSFWFLLDTWGSQFALMRLIGLRGETLEDPLLRTIGFTFVGGIMGSLLYQIRSLFYFYALKKTYDPAWFGKYITAPWEGAGMAMVVLSLIRGGVSVFGGSMGTDVTGASNFAAFGTGALVGFGMRDVVGWLGSLIHTMFTIRRPEGSVTPGREDEKDRAT